MHWALHWPGLFCVHVRIELTSTGAYPGPVIIVKDVGEVVAELPDPNGDLPATRREACTLALSLPNVSIRTARPNSNLPMILQSRGELASPACVQASSER